MRSHSKKKENKNIYIYIYIYSTDNTYMQEMYKYNVPFIIVHVIHIVQNDRWYVDDFHGGARRAHHESVAIATTDLC